MFKLILIDIFSFFLIVSCVSPDTDVSLDEIKHKYFDLIVDCSHDYPLNKIEIEQLKSKQMPESEAARCLFACAYKKAGMMNDEGMLSVEGVNELVRIYLADNPERMEQAIKFTDACKSVNDVEVKDGHRGCDRAALIFKCSVEKAPLFDFKM